MQRVAIFVDVQNMFYSAKNIFGAKVNYKTLLDELVNGRELVRAVAFVIQRPDISQEGFIEALERIGYEVQIKEVRNRLDAEGKSKPVKGSYDLDLGLAAIQIAQKVDVIVLVSGEGTYAPLAMHLRTHGCKVEVAGFEGCTSNNLIDSADDYIPIEKEWTLEASEKPVIAASAIAAGMETENMENDEEETQPIVAGQPIPSIRK
jgi:uncharacterized LabA/DUF88 family protein